MTLKSNRKRKYKDDEELHFEKQARLTKKHTASKKKVHLLPIKAQSGKIIQQYYEEELPKLESEKPSIVEEVVQEKPECNLPSTKELLENRKMNINEKKTTIANIVSDVLANPESNIKLLGKLRHMFESKDSPESLVTIRKLVTASLGYVFVDIIPGYRIRERTEKEKAVKLSKDVKARYNFEETLLAQYRLYLKNLENMIQKRISPGESKYISAKSSYSLGEIAVRSMADLFSTTAHFNFHQNIATVFIPIANNDKDPAVRKVCCDAISTLFATDKKGTASLYTVKAMAILAKKQGPRKLKVEFINTLMCLRIKVVDYSMISGRANKMERKKKAEEKKKLSKSQRKQLKKEKDLQVELKELAATEDIDEKTKLNTEIVQQIFWIYFRILKHKNGQSADCRVILPSVLEGIAKYAHLINIVFFDDLVKVLQQLVMSGALLARENLHCVYSVFKIISGEGDVINIDPAAFYKLVYNIPFQMVVDQKKESDTISIFINCIEIMLSKRRKHVSLTVLCAFIKRLSSIAMQITDPKSAIAMTRLINQLIKSNSRTQSLFDTESATLGDYDDEIEDPTHSKGNCAVLWDMHLMRRHYAPAVSKSAMRVIHDAKR